MFQSSRWYCLAHCPGRDDVNTWSEYIDILTEIAVRSYGIRDIGCTDDDGRLEQKQETMSEAS